MCITHVNVQANLADEEMRQEEERIDELTRREDYERARAEIRARRAEEERRAAEERRFVEVSCVVLRENYQGLNLNMFADARMRSSGTIS